MGNILICDVCRKEVKKNEGYLLTTSEVIKAPGYWELVARGGMVYDKDRLDQGESISTEAVKYVIEMVEKYASMESGWLVCDDCIHDVMAGIDATLPKDLALEFWETGMEPFLIRIAPKPDWVEIADAIELAVKSFQPYSSYPNIPLFFNKVAYLGEKFRQ